MVTSALRTPQRFTLVLGAAAVATVAGLVATLPGESTESTRVLLTATLGLPLLYSLTVSAKRPDGPAMWRWFGPLSGIAILVAFWWTWSGWSSSIQALRYVQLSVAFHLLAAIAPYKGKGGSNGFWQYNRILFLRFLTAYLYSVVLFAGLAIALVAMDKLFGVPLPSQTYSRLWIVVAFTFNPWFFLAGVPENLEELEQLAEYPTGLRVFTQYVLVPLVALYMTILTLYLVKVIATRAWPNGWIGYLVSSVAVIGLLSWLLLYPLEKREDSKWVRTYTRGFLITLMPAVVMLWLAIYKRVAEYGVTEPRYFLLVLSVWLGGIALFYTFTRSRNIRLIPSSLCALALITFAGPTGAYSLSEGSQSRRLEGILTKSGWLANGHVQQGTKTISVADRKEISATLRYLLQTHGSGGIGSWLPDSIRKSLSAKPLRFGADNEARQVMGALGLEYLDRGASVVNEYFSFASLSPRDVIDIKGYTYAIRFSYWNPYDSLAVGSDYMVRLSADSTALQLSRGANVALTIPLQAIVDRATAFRQTNGNLQLPAEMMRIEAGKDSASALLQLTMIAGMRRKDGAKITSLAGEVFLRLSP
jgi:Domain of unknown function (DUF4153)